MKRRSFLLGGAVFAAACTRGPRLNVYNWSDYVAPGTVPAFEREFGVKVRYSTFESEEEMLAQVMSGNSGWDVVFPAEDFVGPMLKLGLLAPLRHDWIPHLDQLDPAFRMPPWDPELRWSIPYMHGATGILYQKSLIPAPTRWADLWDPRLHGKITMLDDPAEVLGACLRKLGFSLNSGDPSQLRAANAEALAQKPLLRAYLNAEARDQVVAGDIVAAQAWTTTAAQAMAAAPGHLAFVLPADGFARFADNVAILRESRRVELAHQWIDYLLRPAVAASIVAATRTATANAGAQRLLPAQVRDDAVLYPPADVLARAEWLEPQPVASQKLRDRLWTELKSA